MQSDGLGGFLKSGNLEVRRVDGREGDAGVLVCSLPVPRGTRRPLALAGRPTYCHPLGQWPGRPGGPRRLLLACDGAGAGEVLRVAPGARRGRTAPPSARLTLIEESPEEAFFWERHALEIEWRGVTLQLVMGLRRSSGLHWWEACGLAVTEETPWCRVIEAGGSIPHELSGLEHMKQFPAYKHPYLHRHNWLSGHVYARLYANGVCEVYAHHVNSRFFDDGLELPDTVPVIGLRVKGAEADAAALAGAWDGSRTGFSLGAVRFDAAHAARLASPAQPGSMESMDGMLVWQPYLGMELFGGLCPIDRAGDPFIVRAEERRAPRGMGRTIRFSFSLAPDRSPVVGRCLPPPWWYGACEELHPAPLLPVSNGFDRLSDVAVDWIGRGQQAAGFEDGSIPRHERGKGERPEPGWEGEVGYGVFLHAWRRTDGRAHEMAMRSAYHFADVAVDHAAGLVRMHGFAPHAFAVPMQRVHVLVAAHLETGDPYLLQTAMAVLDNAYSVHKNSWPRMAVGRDACFVRGQVLMYRYFGDEHYLRLARDAAADVAVSQRADGSFGDQGGGSGIHGWGAYITKPWMGLMAVGGLLDYLEVAPEDEQILATVRKFADWLMRERYDHKGVMGWGYQHYYRDRRRFFSMYSGTWFDLPGDHLWHNEYLARLLLFCSLRFHDASYFDAWAESRAATPDEPGSDHICAQSLQFLPWLQDRLWNAALGAGGVTCRPVWLGARTPRDASIATPAGARRVSWGGDGRVEAEQGLAVAEPLRVPQGGAAGGKG